MTAKGSGPMTDVVLVCMPQAGVERPSIALGELKACLNRAGIGCHVRYANLMYLEYAGPQFTSQIEQTRAEDGLIDWIFGRAAFPDWDCDAEAYLERLLVRNRRLAERMPDARVRLAQAREQAVAFVDWVADKVLERNPKIVGCSSTFQQHVASLALLARIKRRAPHVVTMMGGANCETRMGRATHRNFAQVDFVASGEADGFFAELCRLALEHGTDVPAEALPYGVLAPMHRATAYPEVCGGDGLPRATTDDMTTVPLPDYDDYFAQLRDNLFAGHILPGLPVESARGCWWGMKAHCTFCGLNGGGMTFRAKPADRMLEELDTLAARYGLTKFEAVDNILPADYFERFVPGLTEDGRAYDVFYETKANLKPHEVEALAAAGVRWIQPGIENLDTRVLKLMRKGVGGWNNVRLLRLARQHGLRLSWTILCDFPGEEDAWYAETAEWLPWLAHLQPGGMTRLRFDRYSPYFDQAEAFGLTLRPAELTRHIYPLPEAELFEIAYYFEADEAGRSAAAGRSLLSGGPSARPGLDAMREVVLAWSEAWRGAPPRLVMREEAGAPLVEDTRPAAVAGETLLDPLSAAILHACDDAPARRWLERSLSEAGHAPQAVARAVDSLIGLRFLLPLDGRLINLVLRDPVPPLPTAASFPGGMLLPQPLVRAAAQ
jgi:ribosomal peptide maturation radical SAM protein 1